MYNCLELFSGTKSFGKVVDQFGWKNTSLDLDNKFEPDININILDWDHTEYPPDTFDIIWASPPCTEYSKAKSRGVRDIEGANKIVLKVLEIIKYFNPCLWIIENPQTSLLKKQPFMIELEKEYFFHDADYCMYGKPYRKRTRFWTNKEHCELKLCDKNCGSIINNKHIGSCGNGTKKYTDKSYSVDEKHSIPPDLIFSLLQE
tara:strand:- start:1344 stop:1952 length:609 start_codon:yes stop_codon:yes gene_type:complete